MFLYLSAIPNLWWRKAPALGNPVTCEKLYLSSRNDLLIRVLGQDSDGRWVPRAMWEGGTGLPSVQGPGGEGRRVVWLPHLASLLEDVARVGR